MVTPADNQISHLDVEFKVLVHGKDVVENVLSDTRDDTHLVRVVQLALQVKMTGKDLIWCQLVNCVFNCQTNVH